jgi:hypothetical protein
MACFARCFHVVLVFLFLASCSGSSSSESERWLRDTSTPLPVSLSQVGIFENLATRGTYDDVIAYEPEHALYSNGLRKERHIYLPEGSEIDVGQTSWSFPLGTVLAKTFLDGETPIETRLVFLSEAGWDYAIYQWTPERADAELLEGNWAEVPIVREGGERVHTLPSKLDCRTCHETHQAVAGAPVLGISALQTGQDLVDAGVFSELPELEPVEGRTPKETEALGYFVGNCISCHNGGDSVNSSFGLYPWEAVANTVDQPVVSETGEGIRVVAGEKEQSVLYVTVVEAGEPGYRGPFKEMPPLGIDVPDDQAASILGDWIESL